MTTATETAAVLTDRRRAALEELENAVGHYLHRHDAPDLRGAYIEAREATA